MRKKKENICSLLFGVIATFTILLVILEAVGKSYYSLFFALGMAFNAYALALSPQVLFEKITFRDIGLRNIVFYGGSAVLVVIGNLFFLLSVTIWIVS